MSRKAALAARSLRVLLAGSSSGALYQGATHRYLPDRKVRDRLSIMESKLARPTAEEAAAALLDAETARATLAGRIATPSWFFSSIGVAITVQIAATAAGVGGDP